MKYIKTLVGALVATALLVTVASAAPSTNAPLATPASDLGQWTLSLSGGGSTALGGDAKDVGSAVGGEFQLGHDAKIILPAEVGLRQSIGYSDVNGSSWLFGTKAYTDWTVLRLGNLQFDAGGNVGLTYGNTTPKWTAAPEIVSRLYLKKDVDVFARVEYPFNLTDGKAENRLTYVLGVRVRF
jgi:hypothetical protein